MSFPFLIYTEQDPVSDEQRYSSYDSLDKYNYALETLKLTDANICLDAQLNNCMFQPKCRQPFISNTNRNGDIEITPQLPPRPPLPRSPSSISAKDFEKQQKLSDWYYIKTNSKSPLPPPRPDRRLVNVQPSTIDSQRPDGIYAKNKRFNQKNSRETLRNNQNLFKTNQIRDNNCNVTIDKNIENDHLTTNADENDDGGFARWQYEKQMRLQKLTVNQLVERQNLNLNRSNEQLNDSDTAQHYEELIRPPMNVANGNLAPMNRSPMLRFGELSSSSFEHVNVSNHMLSPSVTDNTIHDTKRFNRSTGNFIQNETIEDNPMLVRQAAAVSQPLQRRRRPPPPPIPTTHHEPPNNTTVSTESQ